MFCIHDICLTWSHLLASHFRVQCHGKAVRSTLVSTNHAGQLFCTSPAAHAWFCLECWTSFAHILCFCCHDTSVSASVLIAVHCAWVNLVSVLDDVCRIVRSCAVYQLSNTQINYHVILLCFVSLWRAYRWVYDGWKCEQSAAICNAIASFLWGQENGHRMTFKWPSQVIFKSFQMVVRRSLPCLYEGHCHIMEKVIVMRI